MCRVVEMEERGFGEAGMRKGGRREEEEERREEEAHLVDPGRSLPRLPPVDLSASDTVPVRLPF